MLIIKFIISKCSEVSEPDFVKSGLFGSINFIIFYFVWVYIYPQPFESFPLRLVGACITFPICFVKYWPHKIKQYVSIYWHIILIYIAYFMCYMLFRNQFNRVWLLTFMASIFLVIIHANWLNFAIIYFFGLTLSLIQLSLEGNITNIPEFAYSETALVFLYALVGGLYFNLHSTAAHQAKIKSMRLMGANIAHEIRTPFAGVNYKIHFIKSQIEKLKNTRHRVSGKKDNTTKLMPEDFEELTEELNSVQNVLENSNRIIDLLLVNAGRYHFDAAQFSVCNIYAIVIESIFEFPFRDDDEKLLVNVNIQNRTSFLGSPSLMKYIIFNLIKNSLRSINAAGKGKIFISTFLCSMGGKRHFELIFKDTGTGIKPENVPYIFDSLYTTSTTGDSANVGLGLAFCKRAVTSMGGEITCQSSYGEYTEIKIRLPVTYE